MNEEAMAEAKAALSVAGASGVLAVRCDVGSCAHTPSVASSWVGSNYARG